LEKSILAVGGDLKNAPAFGLHKDIYLAPYIGDLEDPMTRNDFEKQVKAILALYDIKPEAAVCDLHPRYYSTRWAENRWAESGFPELMKVQHHHAHLLSVMAEHNLDEVIGLAFDGTGYGTDGAIWGGEYLRANRSSFRRLGSFCEFMLPGGEAAIRRPIRIAFSLLRRLMEESGASRENFSEFLTPRDMLLLGEMMEKGLNCPVTTSLGRIFDAAGALLGLVDTTSYEGEGPIRLEGLARVEYERREKKGKGPPSKFFEDLIPLEPIIATEASADRGDFYLDAVPLFAYLAENRKKKDTADLALIFHRAAASASFRGALKMREMTGIGRIALSGGVFQNILLRELLIPELEEAGFEVYLNRSIPPGDGGLAVGQAYFVPG
jgi:hydrogenase maturation protein HypF